MAERLKNLSPPEPQYGGKFPIYVDEVEADALMISLDHDAVLGWLAANGFVARIPQGEDPVLSRKAYFAAIFSDLNLGETIGQEHREARLVFGLLHTVSHICIKHAALLCGLDATSLSEYLFPSTLSFAIYCNHRFGATIGALTALFEQTLDLWLAALEDSRQCVYDPVCREFNGSCHACSHLAETSCRYFNLNVSRSFLFGGPDGIVEAIGQGFFQTAMARLDRR